MPINVLKNIQFFIIFDMLLILFFASSSEIIQVVARDIPEFAIVMKKLYTDITRVNIPSASEPILFEIYILNTKPRPLTKRVDKLKKKPFTKISFDFLKIITLKKDMWGNLLVYLDFFLN